MRACLTITAVLALLSGGCSLMPKAALEPKVFNPFPQLTKVAIAPFFNLSTTPAVDGRQFAQCYYRELQEIQGFEVVPVGVVEQVIEQYGLQMNNATDVRALAQILEVDAVAIGGVTDYDPYYPPRCAFLVEWYAANPYYQPIPAGYGLPWGTPGAESIPAALVHEAEFAAARAALKQQSPDYEKIPISPLPPPAPMPVQRTDQPPELLPIPGGPEGPPQSHRTLSASHVQLIPPPGYPGENCPLPLAAPPQPAPLTQNLQPVIRHVATYSGSDPRVLAALKQYLSIRGAEDFAGAEAFLQVSDDFIRFCCRLHLYEMLSARGGAGKTRVVWQWPESR